MDNQRLFLYGALGLLLLLIWQTWQMDYGADSPSSSPSSAVETAPAPDRPSDTPSAPLAIPDDRPGEQPEGQAPPSGASTSAPGQAVQVRTDLLRITIDTHGASIREALLRQYSATKGSSERVAVLVTEGNRFAVAQSGLQAGERPAPTHYADYDVEQTRYQLAEGDDTLTVPFTWTAEGLRVTKRFTFHRGSYVVDVDYLVENTGQQPWAGRQYRQFQRLRVSDSARPSLLPAFFGAAYFSQADKYEEIAYEDIADSPMQKQIEGGWAAIVDHYFLAAWVPEPEQVNTYYTKALEGPAPRYLIGLYSQGQQIAPGEQGTFSTRMYIGPKVKDHLAGVAPGLTYTIDYGYIGFLAEPLFWLLDHIHSFVGNWGWSIVILTLMIKVVFYKLSETSYRSMARMKKMQPKIQQLKERHGDDREKMGRAMMDMYKKEKINPIGGCLPILVQIPVFIALYWMLLGSVELRHAEWMLWINDLSARDPYFVLPVLMGISMWFQQKLNPAPVDPIQQKVFMALPLVFTVFFAFFPAGLVIYWLTNNILSMAQQYYITRHVVGVDQPAKQSGS